MASAGPVKSKDAKTAKTKKSEDDKSSKILVKIDEDFDSMDQQMKRMAKHLRKLRKEGEYDRAQFYEGKFASFMNDFNTLLKEFNRNSDEVEVLSGDRMLEKYKASVSKSWKHKPEKEDAVKPMGEDEAKKKMETFAQRREELAAKRQAQLALKGVERLAIEAKPKAKVEAEPGAPSRRSSEEGSSSSEDDDEMIERVIVKNDPNPGKLDSKKIKEKFAAAKAAKGPKVDIDDMNLGDLDDVKKYQADLLDSDSD